MSEVVSLGINTPVATELYIPKYDDVVVVEFDGVKLVIDGLLQQEFYKNDCMLARLVLHRTMSKPDTPVPRQELRNDGTVPRSDYVGIAATQAASYFLRTGVVPIKRTMQSRKNKSAHIIESVTFETGLLLKNSRQIEESPQVPRTTRPNVVLGQLPTIKETNDRWIQSILQENSDLRNVPFDLLSEQDVTLCRLLHKNSGAELGIEQFRDIYNESAETPLEVDDFIDILIDWVERYAEIAPLNSRIAMRRVVQNGRRDALFIWHRPKYQGY